MIALSFSFRLALLVPMAHMRLATSANFTTSLFSPSSLQLEAENENSFFTRGGLSVSSQCYVTLHSLGQSMTSSELSLFANCFSAISIVLVMFANQCYRYCHSAWPDDDTVTSL